MHFQSLPSWTIILLLIVFPTKAFRCMCTVMSWYSPNSLTYLPTGSLQLSASVSNSLSHHSHSTSSGSPLPPFHFIYHPYLPILWYSRPSFEYAPSSNVLSRSFILILLGQCWILPPHYCQTLAALFYICLWSIGMKCSKSFQLHFFFLFQISIRKSVWWGYIFPGNSAGHQVVSSDVCGCTIFIWVIWIVSESERHFYQLVELQGEHHVIRNGNALSPCKRQVADEVTPCVWFTALQALLCWYTPVKTQPTATYCMSREIFDTFGCRRSCQDERQGFSFSPFSSWVHTEY